jgi:ABC-type uncharacterized transport system, permease component
MTLIIFALTIGLIYSILSLSVIFSFRVLGFPDLTPDGSFLVGASLGGIILINTESIILSLLLAFLIGAMFGIITSILHNFLKISKLLSGILVMTMLYSVSLRVMNTSNLSLINRNTIWSSNYSEAGQYFNLFLAVIIVFVIFGALLFFLKTNIGLKTRAIGDSENTASNINMNIKQINTLGLAIANGIAGLSGCIIAQFQGFVDVSMGTGLVITCLASIIIGEILLKPKNVFVLLLCSVIGMIIYQTIIFIALRMGLPSTDMKIATVVLTIIFISIEKIRGKRHIINRQIGNRNI